MDQRHIEEIVRRPADFDQGDEGGFLDADILERTHGIPLLFLEHDLVRKPVPTPDRVPDASGAGFFGIMLLSHRSPSPRAMIPRSTSVVPPWSVSLGAIVVAKASCSSNVTRLVVSGSTKAESSRTRAGSFCSHIAPRSFTLD